MLKRICQRCGKRLEPGQKCDCIGTKSRIKQHNAEYDKTKRNRVSLKFYHSKQWLHLKEVAKNRAGGIDEFRYYQGYLVSGEVAHHIIPLNDDPTKALDIDNIIYVSNQTHRYIHAQYDRGGEAKEEMIEALLAAKEWRRHHFGEPVNNFD